MQGSLSVFQAPQVGVCSPLQEHSAVGVVALDHSVAQQEAVLDVDVGVVVQEDLHTARPLPDDGELKRGRTFVAERVNLGLELQQQPDERVPAVVRSHVQGSPAVVAFRVDDVAPVVRLEHQACDAGPAVHGRVVKSSEASD